MERIMAHHIVHEGFDYGLAIAEINDDRADVKIIPFDAEIHSTAWTDGWVMIYRDADGRYFWRTFSNL